MLESLSRLPPLVTSWEVETLKEQLAKAARGEMFLLQGGDCSENLDDCQSPLIASKLKILLQMSLALVYGCRTHVIRVGRFAGQFAKPRSSDIETRDGVSLPSYRGDLINRSGFSEPERVPDPVGRASRGGSAAGRRAVPGPQQLRRTAHVRDDGCAARWVRLASARGACLPGAGRRPCSMSRGFLAFRVVFVTR